MKPFVAGADGEVTPPFDVHDLVDAARANCPLPAGVTIPEMYLVGDGLAELSRLELGELFVRVLALLP